MNPRILYLVAAILAAPAFAPRAHARVVGDIVSVGYNIRSTGQSTRRVIRLGSWTPVVVELSLEGQTRFDGRLRLGQRDRDGDICYDEREVHLLGESGPPQRYTLYALPHSGPNGILDISVELLDQEGERLIEVISGGRAVRSLQPADGLDVLLDDDFLILEVSEGQMGRIATLLESEHFKPARNLNIAHATPSDTPDRWQGLESVDCIIWDDADPDALSDAQRRALAEWTRQGGMLLMASARHAAALAKSDVLGPMLPVEVGVLAQFRKAPSFRKDLLNITSEGDLGYAEDVTAVRCSLRAAPDVRRVFPPDGQSDTDANLDTIIARRRMERGQVIFVGASLRELLDPAGQAEQFFERVLQLRRTQQTEGRYGRDEVLAQYLENHVGFAPLAGVYMLLAMLFVIGYIALATFGSWSFLRSRGWEKHNWSVFAVLAGAAVVVSTLAVQTLLGVGQDLHQLTVVDAAAGRPTACATAYFGLKTGTHSTLDFWMPENLAQQEEPAPTDCFLRVMPPSHEPGPSELTYADPGSYELRPATAELSRVPVRATLKQLEGRWRGELRGTVQASIRIVERTVETGDTKEDGEPLREKLLLFDDASTLTNLLGVDLADAYLFQATENVFGQNFFANSPRAKEGIFVHRLGPLRDQETLNLATRLYLSATTGGKLTRKNWPFSDTLLRWHNLWGSFTVLGRVGAVEAAKGPNLESFQNSLLLLTALSEYDQNNSKLTDMLNNQQVAFSRERCRSLDLSDLLSTDMVLLVGFAREQGPVGLCTRSRSSAKYKRIEPSEAWTLYRIVIPVEAPK